jgi:hypothetical protein
MDRCRDGRKDRLVAMGMDRRTNVGTDGRTDGWPWGWIDGQMKGRTEG